MGTQAIVNTLSEIETLILYTYQVYYIIIYNNIPVVKCSLFVGTSILYRTIEVYQKQNFLQYFCIFINNIKVIKKKKK